MNGGQSINDDFDYEICLILKPKDGVLFSNFNNNAIVKDFFVDCKIIFAVPYQKHLCLGIQKKHIDENNKT